MGDRGGVISMSYTKNEIALETLISNIGQFFYYIGEDDDKIPFSKDLVRSRLETYCNTFIESIEVQ